MYIANHCCSQLTAAAVCCFGALQDPVWNLQCIGRPLRDPLILQQRGRPRNWSQHWCSYRWVGVPDDGYALPCECAGAACSWTYVPCYCMAAVLSQQPISWGCDLLSSRFMAAGTYKSICDDNHSIGDPIGIVQQVHGCRNVQEHMRCNTCCCSACSLD